MSKQYYRYLPWLVLFMTFTVHVNAQADSLHRKLSKAKTVAVRVDLMNEFSKYHEANGQLDSAVEWATRAANLSQEVDYQKGEAESLSRLGVLAVEKRDTAAAFAYFEQVIRVATAANEPLAVAEAHAEMASIYYRDDDYAVARRHYLLAFEGYAELNVLGRMAAMRYNLANVDYHTDNQEAALGNYYQAMELYGQAGNDRGQAQTKLEISTIYLRLGDDKNALNYVQGALVDFSGLADDTGLAKAYEQLANINTDRRDFADALANTGKARAIHDRIGSSKVTICANVVKMGVIYTQMGEYDKALPYFEELQVTAVEIGSKFYQLEAMTWLAETYFKKNEFKQARAWADLSLALGLELDRLTRVKEDYGTLYKIDSALGDFESAFTHLGKFIDYKRKLDNEDAEKTALKYEYERQEKEALLLMQKQRQQRNLAWVGAGFIAFAAAGAGLYGRSKSKHRIEMARVKLQAVKESEQMKSRFFANISHEFRTPLTLINGHLESLKAMPDSQQLAVYNQMERQSKQLLGLINQLLEVSKMESGHHVFQYRSGDVLGEVRAHVQAFHSQAVRKKIVLSFTVSDAAKTGVGDGGFRYAPEALPAIVNNLVSNALKFTPSGGRVDVDVDFQCGKLVVRVSDNGPGIAEDQLPHVFDRFFQAKGDVTSQHTGFGIGLALVKELAMKHGGDAVVVRAPSGGCLFTVTLAGGQVAPQAVPTAPTPAISPSGEVVAAVDGEAPQVLIVEDQPDLRRFIADALAGDYRVSEAFDGEHGLQLASELIPDVIISDVMMPGMDGVTLCGTLKNQDATSHIPVMLLTALADQQDRLAGLDSGADDYLAKPFSMAELRLRLRNMIQSRLALRRKFASGELLLSASQPHLSLRDREFLDRLSATVHAHLKDTQLSVDTLAEVACLSASQLNRKLKALIDQTPAEFIRLIKLEQGMLMLQQGERVTDVAWALGFESPSYFTKVFKKHYGKAPSAV